MTEIPINTKLAMSRHPDSIRGDSLGAKSARVAMGTLYEAEGKILALHSIVKDKALLLHQRQAMANMPKPSGGGPKIAPALVYDQGAASHVIDVGRPLAEAALGAVDKAIVSLGEVVARLDAEISLKVLAGKSSRATELRLWASNLDQPFQKLAGLMQKGNENPALVAAILEGEPYLSNLTPENQNHLRVMASKVLAPDQVQARAETSKALEQLTNAAKSFTETAGGIFNSLASPEIGAIDSIVKTGGE